MNRIWLAAALGVLATTGTTHPALAWGDRAHQVVCEIALQEMQPATRQTVKDLIAQDVSFDTFSESCVWPDHPRKRAPEHFINLPRTATSITAATCPGVATCLFTAIEADAKVLKSQSTSAKDKLASLKFLGHWVGDIHQPLHVSYKDDRGGNEIDAKGKCHSDLHAAWDTCILEKRKGTDVKEIATTLRGQITDAQRTQWKASTPVKWADESYQITTSTPVRYCVKKNGACQYDLTHKTLSPTMAHKSVSVSQPYIDTNGPDVELRVKQAGVRLAKLLDETLGAP